MYRQRIGKNFHKMCRVLDNQAIVTYLFIHQNRLTNIHRQPKILPFC